SFAISDSARRHSASVRITAGGGLGRWRPDFRWSVCFAVPGFFSFFFFFFVIFFSLLFFLLFFRNNREYKILSPQTQSTHLEYINSLQPIPNQRDQAIIISFDVENCAITYRIRMPKALSDLREVLPGGFARNVVPIQQRIFGVRMPLPEFAQSPLADDSHGAI